MGLFQRLKPRFKGAGYWMGALSLCLIPGSKALAGQEPAGKPPEAVADGAAPGQPGARDGKLPENIQPGHAVKLPVKGDKPLLVIHAKAGVRRAIVYLHGICGNIHAVEDWKQAAAAHGTLIALHGDHACRGGRFRWAKNVTVIQARIHRALLTARAARGGQLDLDDVVLFGYSQGAARAEKLVARYPDKYARIVLGGPPRKPKARSFKQARVVAVFGGEKEQVEHMRLGVEDLTEAGKPSRFFLLPRAKHGEYGPEGNRVMNELLDWLTQPEFS